MATYTSNLNLKKPALDDDALITDINNNMDILDAAANGIEDALAIVANGNTHAAITSGQFVYVRNHNTLTEGLYVASSNIAANATLSSSNLAADSKGGLNSLSDHITNIEDALSGAGLTSSMTANDIINLPTGGYVNRNAITNSDIIPYTYGGLFVCRTSYYVMLFFIKSSSNVSNKTFYYAIEIPSATSINWIALN